MKAFITGIGWVTAAGPGQGRRRDRFAMPEGPLPTISRKDLFADPYPRFGRLDDFSRLGLAGIALALTDAGLDQWQNKRNIGIFAGTTGGCLGTDLAYFETVLPAEGSLASPNLFAYTLPNTFLGEAAIRFGLTGPSWVANPGDGNALGCLGIALESLAFNECPIALAGFCDLEHPSILTEPPANRGTVFLTLAREPGDGTSLYGEIRQDSPGQIRFEGNRVCDWIQLVRACLEQEPG